MSGTKRITRHGEDRFVAKGDRDECYIEVVPSGKRTYLWIGGDTGPAYTTVSGPATLRKLAHEILEQVGD